MSMQDTHLRRRIGGVKPRDPNCPAPEEGLAIVVAIALTSLKYKAMDFEGAWEMIAQEVRRAESSPRVWAPAQLRKFWFDGVLNGIPEHGYSKFLQREFKGLSPPDRDRREFRLRRAAHFDDRHASERREAESRGQ